MQTYTIGALGNPPITDQEDGYTEAAAINKSGVIAGYTAGEATVWEAEQLKKLPMPGNRSFSTDINDFETVVGMHHVVYPSRAFIARVNQFVDLDPLLPGVESSANAINNDGLVTGWAGDVAAFQPYIYDSIQGTITLIDPLPGHTQAAGFGINSAGHIAGTSRADNVPSRLFFYRDGETFDAGQAAWLSELNDSDVAVGSFGNPSRAYRADLSSGTAVFENLGLTPKPGYIGSHGNAINNTGVVVGHSFSTLLKVPPRAFVHFPADHPDAGLHDLQSLVDDADGWMLEEARGINDDGVIVGNGTHHGKMRSFVLYPSRPRPSFENLPSLQFIKLFGGSSGGGGVGITPGGKPIPIPPPLLAYRSEADRDVQLGIALENFARGLGDHRIAAEIHALGTRLREDASRRGHS
jgi:hypothetical protein